MEGKRAYNTDYQEKLWNKQTYKGRYGYGVGKDLRKKWKKKNKKPDLAKEGKTLSFLESCLTVCDLLPDPFTLHQKKK